MYDHHHWVVAIYMWVLVCSGSRMSNGGLFNTVHHLFVGV